MSSNGNIGQTPNLVDNNKCMQSMKGKNMVDKRQTPEDKYEYIINIITPNSFITWLSKFGCALLLWIDAFVFWWSKIQRATYLPGCRTPAAGSPTRAQPPPWAEPRWICRWLWWESSSAAKRQNNRARFRTSSTKLLSVQTQLLHVPHHVSVLLVVEVESRQDGFEFAEDLVVPRHVRGQDAPAGRANRSVNSDLATTRRNRQLGQEGWSHLMMPSLIRLYWSTARFLKMLLSVWKAENPQCILHLVV